MPSIAQKKFYSQKWEQHLRRTGLSFHLYKLPKIHSIYLILSKFMVLQVSVINAETNTWGCICFCINGLSIRIFLQAIYSYYSLKNIDNNIHIRQCLPMCGLRTPKNKEPHLAGSEDGSILLGDLTIHSQHLRTPFP